MRNWSRLVVLLSFFLILPAAAQGVVRHVLQPGVDVASLVFSPDGRLWVATNRGVRTVDAQGDATTIAPDELDQLIIGPDGAVWGDSASTLVRIDPATGTIQRFTVTGRIGTIGNGPDGAIWVLVERYPAGTFLVRMTTAGVVLSDVPVPGFVTSEEGMLVPWTAGSVLAAGYPGSAMRIGRITATGVAEPVTLPLADPFWLHDAGDFLWVADLNRGGVARITRAGAVLATYQLDVNGFSGSTVDANGNLWVSTEGYGDVLRVSPAGVVTRVMDSPFGWEAECPTDLHPMAASLDGRIALAQSPLGSQTGPPSPCGGAPGLTATVVIFHSSHTADVPALGTTALIALAGLLGLAAIRMLRF